MAGPAVTVNGATTFKDISAAGLGVVVNLGVASPPGGATFNWSFVDQPPNTGSGTQATLTSPTSATPTFTPENEGSYLVQCVINQGMPTVQTITGLAFVRQFVSGERVPAAGETLETDGLGATELAAGWAVSLNSLLRRLDALAGDPGVVVGVAGAAGLALGNVVMPVGGSASAGSFQAPNGKTYSGWMQVPATSAQILNGKVGVVLGGVNGGGVGTLNAFIQVRVLGLITGVAYTGSAPAVGALVFAPNSGALDGTSLSPGTNYRELGVVAAVNTTAKTFDVFVG